MPAERFDAARHFARRARRYEDEAFHVSTAAEMVGHKELDIVVRRLGSVAESIILDAGIGSGRVSAELSRLGARMIGIDATPEMLHMCRQRHLEADLMVARLGGSLPFASDAFDHAVCIRVIKYVADWPTALAELRRVLKRHGKLVLEITNRNSLARWGYPRMPVSMATAREICGLLEQTGFLVEGLDAGPRLPFPLYRRVHKEWGVRFIRVTESAANKLLGPSTLARSFFITSSAR